MKYAIIIGVMIGWMTVAIGVGIFLVIDDYESSKVRSISMGWFVGETMGCNDGDDFIIIDPEYANYFSGCTSTDEFGNSYCLFIPERIPYSQEKFDSLIKLVNIEKFNAFPDIIGHGPGAMIESEYIEIKTRDNSKTVTYRNWDRPQELKELSSEFTELRDYFESISAVCNPVFDLESIK